MKRLILAASLLFSISALAVDKDIYPAHLDRTGVSVPQSWFTSNTLEFAAGYIYQDSEAANQESDGHLLSLRAASSLPYNFDLSGSISAFQLKDVLSDKVKLSTAHFGLGYLARLHPWIALRPEAGLFLISAKGENLGFPAESDLDAQPYGRLEFVTKLVGENDFKVYAQRSKDAKTLGSSLGLTSETGRHAFVITAERQELFDATGFTVSLGYRRAFDR